MRYASQANRGKSFENFIGFANQVYRRKGIAMIEKQYVEILPIRNGRGQVVTCKIGEKSTVDYIGRYGSVPIALEAKDTNSGVIRFDAVQPHQAAYLDDFSKEPGTIALVLISFNLERFYAVPWAFWGTAYDIRVRRNDRAQSINLHAFGQEWHIPPKFSVREEELLPEWQVPSNDRKYGLHYLINAEKYVSKKYNLQEKTE